MKGFRVQCVRCGCPVNHVSIDYNLSSATLTIICMNDYCGDRVDIETENIVKSGSENIVENVLKYEKEDVPSWMESREAEKEFHDNCKTVLKMFENRDKKLSQK